MSFKHVEAIEVSLSGEKVGVVATVPNTRNSCAFEYYPSWIKSGVSISPIHLPLTQGAKNFHDLPFETWYGLPPAIADALPDRFGNSLINAHLAMQGVSATEITAFDRLAYVADRAMGALEFKPAYSFGKEPEGILDIVELVTAAREALQESFATDKDSKKALQNLLSVGVSAGGARAKAVINVDPLTHAITAGHRPEAGKESWLIKFDGVGRDSKLGESQQFGRIEYAYSLMVRDAGITMPETHLLKESGRAHFMIRRFDRIDISESKEHISPQKVHMQSLCAMAIVDFNLIRTNEYGSLFMTINQLGLGDEAKVEAFRRMAFNHLAANCDDHSKNFSFLMDRSGTWFLAPAYDVTFAYDPQSIWLKGHLMGVNGKFSQVTRRDLIKFADAWQVPYARRSLKQIDAVLENWPEYARQAEIPHETTAYIASMIARHE